MGSAASCCRNLAVKPLVQALKCSRRIWLLHSSMANKSQLVPLTCDASWIKFDVRGCSITGPAGWQRDKIDRGKHWLSRYETVTGSCQCWSGFTFFELYWFPMLSRIAPWALLSPAKPDRRRCCCIAFLVACTLSTFSLIAAARRASRPSSMLLHIHRSAATLSALWQLGLRLRLSHRSLNFTTRPERACDCSSSYACLQTRIEACACFQQVYAASMHPPRAVSRNKDFSYADDT